MEILTEKKLHTRLNNYYKKYYGERDTDEWYVNPAENVWKFKRDGKIIIIFCNRITGEVLSNSWEVKN